MDNHRSATLGIITPVFFWVSVLILSSKKPGYSHIYNTISELGEVGSPDSWVVSVVFVVTGLMLLGFGVFLHKQLKRADRRVWTGVFIALYAVLDFIASGVFPIDAGGFSESVVGSIHVWSTVFGELSASAVPFMFLLDTEGVGKWGFLRRMSKLVSILMVPVVIFLGYAISTSTPGSFNSLIGLAQRIFVGLTLGWIFITGLSFWRDERKFLAE